MSSATRRVLVIEDESAQRLMYSRALSMMGYEPVCVGSSEAAWKAMQTTRYGVALLDLNLGGENGLDVFEYIRDHHPEVSVVVATGFGTFEIAKQAIKMDVVDFLSKPVSLGELESSMNKAWDRYELVQSPAEDLVPPDSSVELEVEHRNDLNIEAVEQDLIIEALRRCKDNRKAAAKMLGISERKLYYRLSQYGIR